MNELLLTGEFIELSRYAGMRFDLVQAGGGNTSVKLDDRTMLVKASGAHLSEIQESKGYVEVDYPEIARIVDSADEWCNVDRRLRDIEVVRRVGMATKPSPTGTRASIEVFMHAVLGRFVLHTHPIAVNHITCRKDWDKILKGLFPDSLCISYCSPGIDLGVKLYEVLRAYQSKSVALPKLIFLQNHGLLIHGDTQKDVQELTDNVVMKCEDFCGVDLRRYRMTSKLAAYIGDGSIACLSEDQELIKIYQSTQQLEHQRPLYPDSFVFCGVEPMVLEDLKSPRTLEMYRKKYQGSPKVVLLNGLHYFIAQSVKKAKEVEEVYKAHALVLGSLLQVPNYLSDDELAYLCNWEAEKYRKEK
jgi:rhamnose utilization protein RhaD (predicted bifunctional aldolase and dehydrogenase)